MQEERVFPPPKPLRSQAYIKSEKEYETLYR